MPNQSIPLHQQQSLDPSQMASGQQQPLNVLNDLVKKGISTLSKIQEEQIVDAVRQGVPIDNIAGQLQQKIQQPQEVDEKKKMGILKRFLIGAGEGLAQGHRARQADIQSQLLDNLIKQQKLSQSEVESPQDRLARAKAELAEQELRGESADQQLAIRKFNADFFNNVLQSTGKKTLSDTAVKTLENARLGVEQTTELLNQFEADPSLFKGIGGPWDPRSQQVGFMRKNLADTIGRLRSGGAINEDEQKTFLNFIPRQGIVKGRTEAPETVLFKLKTINKLFQGVVNGIQPAKDAAALTSKIQQALDEGHSPDEITQFLGL